MPCVAVGKAVVGTQPLACASAAQVTESDGQMEIPCLDSMCLSTTHRRVLTHASRLPTNIRQTACRRHMYSTGVRGKTNRRICSLTGIADARPCLYLCDTPDVLCAMGNRSRPQGHDPNR